MTKKICENCQYFRLPAEWCSNSKSMYSQKRVKKSGSCLHFYQRGRKVPWWLRRAVKAMEKINGR